MNLAWQTCEGAEVTDRLTFTAIHILQDTLSNPFFRLVILNVSDGNWRRALSWYICQTIDCPSEISLTANMFYIFINMLSRKMLILYTSAKLSAATYFIRFPSATKAAFHQNLPSTFIEVHLLPKHDHTQHWACEPCSQVSKSCVS